MYNASFTVPVDFVTCKYTSEEKSSVTIELTAIDNKTVRKNTHRTDLDHKWLELYRKLSDIEPALVKIQDIVLDATGSVILMENLVDTHTLHFPEYVENMAERSVETNQKFLTNYFNLIRNLLVFAQKHNFIHDDVNHGNLMVDTDGNIKLVDPDAFVYIDKENRYEIQYKLLLSYTYLIDRIGKQIKDTFERNTNPNPTRKWKHETKQGVVNDTRRKNTFSR